jgi:hypothetical protein
MRDFAEIWGNASDHATNNFSFCWRKIPLKIEGVMEKANDRRSAILTPPLVK